MVLKLEQILGSKNSITVLRCLVLQPSAWVGLTELAETVHISKSNVLRVLGPLQQHRLIVEQKAGRKKLFRINSEQELVPALWKAFMIEKKGSLPAEFKNVIDLFFQRIQGQVDVFILFGSVARNLATRESDIDLLVVGDQKLSGPNLNYLPFRFEVHSYSWDDLKEKKDFVVLEALLNGIVYKGEVYPILKDLKSFPKAYLIYRLVKAKEFLAKAARLESSAKEYYTQLAAVSLGEIKSLLTKKRLQPKKYLKSKVSLKTMTKLEEKIAKEGDEIWIL